MLFIAYIKVPKMIFENGAGFWFFFARDPAPVFVCFWLWFGACLLFVFLPLKLPEKIVLVCPAESVVWCRQRGAETA